MPDQPDASQERGRFFTTLPGILTGVAALLTAMATVAGVFFFRDSGEQPPADGAGQGATSELEAEDFYTLDGSVPRMAPSCEGIMNLCLGTPVEAAISLLGPEDERFGMEGQINRQWRIGDAYITVESDEIGSIVSLTAATNPGTAFRLLLPGAIVLGESTMQDVLDKRGEPDFQDDWIYENTYHFYEYHYCEGLEGAVGVTFTHAADYGRESDPGSLDLVWREPLSSYTVEYGCRWGTS